MNLSTWSDFFRIVIIIGSTLAVIGTIGHYAVGKILDRQKNQRIEDLEKGNSALKKELEETAKLAEPVRLTL